MNTHNARLKLLKDLNYSPKGILDIGAHTGEWTDMAHKIFPNTPFYLIEGNTDHEKTIAQKINHIKHKSPLSKYSIELLSDKQKIVTYHKSINAGSTGNSIYKENTSHFSPENSTQESRNTVTLDKLLSENNEYYDFIKIDVQGSELDIISGGEKTISGASYVLIETQLMDYNKGAPLANEIINHLSLLGFVIFDIYELHYTDDGRLNEIDIMFCRPDNHLLSHSHTHAPNKRSMWLKYDICLNRESPRKIISQLIKRASRKKYKD